MFKKTILIIFIFTAVNIDCRGSAFEGKSETVLPFLKINPSVNSSAMAGANAPTLEGIESVYLNPAGIAAMESIQVYAQYTKWIDEINMGYIAAGRPVAGLGNLGFSLGYIQYPSQTQTIADSASKYNYSELGSFKSNTGYMGSYISASFGEKILGGIGMKYVFQNIGDFKKVAAFAFDTGVILKANNYSNYGLSLNNLSWGAKYGSKSEPLPAIIRLGGKWKYTYGDSFYARQIRSSGMQYLFELCVEMRQKDGVYVNAGIEFVPVSFLSIKTGYSYALESDDLGGISGLSAGIIFQGLAGIDIEYACSSFGRLGFVHRVGLKLSL